MSIESVDSTAECLGFSFSDETCEEENLARSTPPSTTDHGEYLKSIEDLARATQPYLRALDREQEIVLRLSKIRDGAEKFSLTLELFRLKMQVFLQEGGSVQRFLEEAKERTFKGKNGVLKGELFTHYAQLFMLMPSMKKDVWSISYPSPYLQLYELEQESGFNFNGTLLLKLQYEVYDETLRDMFLNRIGIEEPIVPCHDKRYKEYYWDISFPGMQRIMDHLESEGETKLLKRLLERTIILYLEIGTYNVIPNKEIDPLVELFPYIIKHDSMDLIEDYIFVRFSYLNDWDVAYKWVDLHCQAAEMLAPDDQEKAEAFLKKARGEVKARIWAFPFSPNKQEWEATREKAFIRVTQQSIDIGSKIIHIDTNDLGAYSNFKF